MDRGIIDNYFWYQLYYNKQEISKEDYKFYLKQLLDDVKLLDKLFLLTAKTDEIMKRDYNASIYIEDRNKTNKMNVENLTNAYSVLGSFLEKSFDDIIKIDTSSITSRDTSIIIAEETIKSYQKKHR